jgi:hypothetical protein
MQARGVSMLFRHLVLVAEDGRVAAARRAPLDRYGHRSPRPTRRFGPGWTACFVG